MRMIRLPEVMNRVALGRSAIYERIKAGTFPAPVKQGRASAWPDDKIDEYLRGLTGHPANQPTPASS